ncbi:MAG: hypothetical protein RBQ63_00305 [Acholeplasmatales bacterium]|jgi:hypothetical protein|nr:hypothetical protein [Acholeplasmataceae bacterium]MDD4468618.1 hypothetical protein [Acholeplasmataceae bacterium]MDY0316195.1 hypothetical protein [Acholeplasmatales bacterium]
MAKQTKKTKSTPKQEVKQTAPGEIPVFRSPSKTTWGKVVIIIIVSAMVILPIAGLVFILINR